MVYYAAVIQKLRKESGLPPANLSHLDSDEAIQNEQSNRKKNLENDNNHKERSRASERQVLTNSSPCSSIRCYPHIRFYRRSGMSHRTRILTLTSHPAHA
jgi:hypothetical protein